MNKFNQNEGSCFCFYAKTSLLVFKFFSAKQKIKSQKIKKS